MKASIMPGRMKAGDGLGHGPFWHSGKSLEPVTPVRYAAWLPSTAMASGKSTSAPPKILVYTSCGALPLPGRGPSFTTQESVDDGFCGAGEGNGPSQSPAT